MNRLHRHNEYGIFGHPQAGGTAIQHIHSALCRQRKGLRATLEQSRHGRMQPQGLVQRGLHILQCVQCRWLQQVPNVLLRHLIQLGLQTPLLHWMLRQLVERKGQQHGRRLVSLQQQRRRVSLNVVIRLAAQPAQQGVRFAAGSDLTMQPALNRQWDVTDVKILSTENEMSQQCE